MRMTDAEFDIAHQEAIIKHKQELHIAKLRHERNQKRDVFAAAALTGMLAGRDIEGRMFVEIARNAFEMADYMLRESERRSKE